MVMRSYFIGNKYFDRLTSNFVTTIAKHLSGSRINQHDIAGVISKNNTFRRVFKKRYQVRVVGWHFRL
jgi:hypothetical protein